MIETAAEREKRRTREPELEWVDVTPDDGSEILVEYSFSETMPYCIRVRPVHPKPCYLYVWVCSERKKLGHYKGLDQAKLAAHEHWRENGYE